MFFIGNLRCKKPEEYINMTAPTLIKEERENLNPAEQSHATTLSEAENIHLISEGAYGCIYYPGISCHGTKENRNYITKIQKNTDITENEKQISDIIRSQIRGYYHYFSPIVKQCPVSIARRFVADIKKCRVFKDDSEEQIESSTYISNKVRYLGNQNIQEYVYSLYGKPEFWETVVETHLRLLDAIELLLESNLIHMDIKAANVMVDHTTLSPRPILIDFGISMNRASFNRKKAFYIYETYTPWCIDIVLCNYAVNRVFGRNASSTHPVSAKDIDEIVHVFKHGSSHTPKQASKGRIKNGVFSTSLVPLSTKHTFEESIRAHLTQYATWGDVYNEAITRYSETWDNYSVAIMYMDILEFIRSSSTSSEPDPSGFLQPYVEIVQSVVYSIPPNRPGISQTRKALVNLLVQIQGEE